MLFPPTEGVPHSKELSFYLSTRIEMTVRVFLSVQFIALTCEDLRSEREHGYFGVFFTSHNDDRVSVWSTDGIELEERRLTRREEEDKSIRLLQKSSTRKEKKRLVLNKIFPIVKSPMAWFS